MKTMFSRDRIITNSPGRTTRSDGTRVMRILCVSVAFFNFPLPAVSVADSCHKQSDLSVPKSRTDAIYYAYMACTRR